MRKISKDKIIGEIAAVAFSDFTKFVSLETLPERGQVMTVTDTALLNRQSAKAVASIKVGTKGIEVKLYDKLRALELLGKIYGVFGGDISEEEAVENLKKATVEEIAQAGGISQSVANDVYEFVQNSL